MPELPEVESARSVIERAALGRTIVDVDDTDTYECRPHQPGQIRAALLGRTLTVAHRRGRSMWCDTSREGPTLGIHLGMSGKIVIADGQGSEVDGGDYWERGRKAGDPPLHPLLPDLRRRRLAPSRRPPPARPGTARPSRRSPRARRPGDHPDPVPGDAGPQLDAAEGPAARPGQHRRHRQPAGRPDRVGGQAESEGPARDLTRPEADRLLRAMRRTIAQAVEGGGVHTLSVVPFRRAGAVCPRDGAPMVRGTAGGLRAAYHQLELPPPGRSAVRVAGF